MKSLLFFVFLFLKVDSFQCPPESFQVPQENVCMVFVNQTDLFLNAIQKCAALGGRIAKIQNVFENAYIISNPLYPLDSFIGVNKQANGDWTYSDGSALIYQNWAPNEPSNSTNITNACAIVTRPNGQWFSVDCTAPRTYLCSIDADDLPPCSTDWVYNDQTDSCYYLQNFTYPDQRQLQYFNWTSAEENCQRMGAHLVSIHNKAEDDFVYDLIATNVGCYWTWIGYYGSGALGTGSWTDGSPIDYNGYGKISGSVWWLMMNDRKCSNSRRWSWSSSPTSPYPRFVCKKASQRRLAREMKKHSGI